MSISGGYIPSHRQHLIDSTHEIPSSTVRARVFSNSCESSRPPPPRRNAATSASQAGSKSSKTVAASGIYPPRLRVRCYVSDFPHPSSGQQVESSSIPARSQFSPAPHLCSESDIGRSRMGLIRGGSLDNAIAHKRRRNEGPSYPTNRPPQSLDSDLDPAILATVRPPPLGARRSRQDGTPPPQLKAVFSRPLRLGITTGNPLFRPPTPPNSPPPTTFSPSLIHAWSNPGVQWQ